MKWYQSHNAVIEAFVDAPMDERGGKASNLFFEKMCSLGNVWHRVYEAQGAGTHGAIVSWSSGGGFD